MKNKTYKTDHPNIKKITVGDRFITNSGKIVTFIVYEIIAMNKMGFFKMDIGWYDNNLMYNGFQSDIDHCYHIIQKIASLKDKLELL